MISFATLVLQLYIYGVIIQLGRLLRRASSDDYLEDSNEKNAHPSWSRAVGMCSSMCVLLALYNIIITAKENDTLRFGLVAPSTKESKVFISHSDLHHLTQIDGGTLRYRCSGYYVHTA